LIKIIDNNESDKRQSKKTSNIDQKLIKEKEKNKKNEKHSEVKDHHKRNKDIPNLINNKNMLEENNNVNNSLLTTMKNCSFYINEQKKLAEFIKKYYNENGRYPESQINFYKYGRILGKGAFGKVNIALHIASGRLVAIKSFNKKKLLSKHSRQKIKIEIEVLSKIRSPFSTRIYDTFQTDTHILIVMEYIVEDLLSFMRKRGKLSEKLCKIIFKQLIKGIKHIHNKNIVHRDIKLDNILLDLSNTVKICDFGVSKFIKDGDIMHEHCGTPAYIAPEIFRDKGYEGFSCDVWSAGVTLYYMLSGYQPFKGNDISEIQKSIMNGEFEKIKDVSNEANDLINKMLEINPKKRITIDQILNHPWIKNINVNNRKNLDLFTKTEKFLLSKYNVCYLNSDTEELIENFTVQNLNSVEEKEKKGNTKSVILAPYNTYITNEGHNDYNDDDIEIRNDICRYKGQAQLSNIKYELSYNNEFDNGIFKTQNKTIFNSAEDKKSTSIYNELLTEKTESLNLSCDDKENFAGSVSEDIIKEIEDKIGYDQKYLKLCLKNNEINYATATYYLMIKEKEK
jgi:serine/threonine protein kinase